MLLHNSAFRKEQDKPMNRKDGSCELPHVYDYLLSTTAIPSRQSGRQQRLPKRQQLSN